MILSAADIKAVLSGDPVIRLVARIQIVDGRPRLSGGNGVVIYINRFPETAEYEATWKIWIIDYDNEPVDLVVEQMAKLLPGFATVSRGSITEVKTTELLSGDTQLAPIKEKQTAQVSFELFERRFQELVESIQDRMLLVGPGRPGRDGKDGRDGLDGRDGKDINATDVSLDDLNDTDLGDAKPGQFLMFDGLSWVARFVPQISAYARGSGGTSEGGGIPEAPLDGQFYVRKDGEWITLQNALYQVNLDAGEAS